MSSIHSLTLAGHLVEGYRLKGGSAQDCSEASIVVPDYSACIISRVDSTLYRRHWTGTAGGACAGKIQCRWLAHVLALVYLLAPPPIWATDKTLPATGADKRVIRLAATTTTDNSGLLDYLLEAFSASTGYQIQSTVSASGTALKQAERGDADAVLVHSPLAEQDFMADGFGLRREEFMVNDFILVGPRENPAGVEHQGTLSGALRAIATNGLRFVSRGDDSGTHQRELALWNHAGVEPQGRWYMEAGQSMAGSLRIASELQAYALTDRGTWMKLDEGLDLDLLLDPDPAELNHYAVISVNPARHPHVNADGAEVFINWLLSTSGQQTIAEYTLDGRSAYVPLHLSADDPDLALTAD